MDGDPKLTGKSGKSAISYLWHGRQHLVLFIGIRTRFSFADGPAAIAASNSFFGEEWTLGCTGTPEFAVLNEDQPHRHEGEKQTKYCQTE